MEILLQKLKHLFTQALSNYCLTLQVFIPTKVYNGQKLIKEVSKNTPPKISNTMPNVPVTVPVK